MVKQNMDMSFEVVGPKEAVEWLKTNIQNRSVSTATVSKYARDMENGQWKDFCPDGPLMFDKHGNLRNGQHRLKAIIKSNHSAGFCVWTNCPEDVMVHTDMDRSRSALDQAKAGGLADENLRRDDFSIARKWYLYGIKTDDGDTIKYDSPSVSELIKFVSVFDQMIEFARKNFRSHSRGTARVAVQAAISSSIYYEPCGQIERFISVLSHGVTSGEDDKAAVLLRDFIRDSTITGHRTPDQILMKKSQRAVKAFCDRQPLSRLLEPKDFIYYPPNPERLLEK